MRKYELTVDSVQLTVVVSLRDGFEWKAAVEEGRSMIERFVIAKERPPATFSE